MFRECCRHEALVAQLLSPPHCRQTYVLFGFIESPFFDVASDAFASLRELLTKHRAVAARFLEAISPHLSPSLPISPHISPSPVRFLEARDGGEMWGEVPPLDLGMWGDMGRYGEIWGDMA